VASERMPKLKQIIDPILARALTHPLRGHILLTIGERGVVSPKEIALTLGMDLKEVSYHVRSLKARGLIRLVRTEKRRGVEEHYYELTEPVLYLDDQEWAALPKQIQARFSVCLLRVLVGEALEALRAGTFNAEDCHQSRVTMPLDAQGKREAAAVLADALERLLDIRSQCLQRVSLPSAEASPMTVFMTAFETATGAERPLTGERGGGGSG
jgi:DNA-binding transcriptional ArsR family regulator